MVSSRIRTAVFVIGVIILPATPVVLWAQAEANRSTAVFYVA